MNKVDLVGSKGRIITINDIVSTLANHGRMIRIQQNDRGFSYRNTVDDQTTRGAQAEIEFIFQKIKDTQWTNFP